MTKTGTQYVMAALMPSARRKLKLASINYNTSGHAIFLINFIDIQQQKDTTVNNTSAYGLWHMFTTIIYSEAAAPGGCLKMVAHFIGVNPCDTNFSFHFYEFLSMHDSL